MANEDHIEDRDYGEEVVDGTPVLVDVRPVQRVSPAALPAVQAAVAAATGFVAGAAMIALIRHRTTRKLAGAGAGRRRAADGISIVGTRSFLVDVHLVARPGE